MNLLIAILLVLIDSIVDGLKDNIDHHKGNQVLYHVYHLLKHIDRLIILSIGYLLYVIIREYSILVLLLLAVLIIIIGKLFWNYSYYNNIAFWQDIDNRVDLSTGIYFIDKILGFDKPINNPIFSIRGIFRKIL